MAKPPKTLAQRTIPKEQTPVEISKEQLQEFSLVGLNYEKPKERSSNTQTISQTIMPEHSLEQLIELQRIGILSIYPRKRE